MKLRGLIALALAFVLISEPALAQVNQGTSPLSIPKGGTGGATAAAARTSLGAIGGPGSSTDRGIPTWNGTSGLTLRNNPTISINSLGAVQMDSGTGATTVLWNVPSTGMLDNGLANSTLMVGNGGTSLVHNAGTFTATITGTDMNVTAITTGTVPVERISTATLSGSGVTVGTQIRAQVSGTPGGIGHYTVSPSQTVASPTAMTAVSLQGRYIACIGLTTCLNMTTASYDTFGGFETGEFCTTCFGNAGWGEANQIYNIDGAGNDSSGWKALLGTLSIGLGDYNTCHGYFTCSNSGQSAPTSRNTGYGAFALSAATLSSNGSTAVGYNSAGVLTSGSGLFLGENAAPTLTTGLGNFFAAAGQAGSGVITGSNDMILGSCSGLSSSLTSMVQLCDGAGNVAFRNDSNRDTYLGDGATGRKVYVYFSSATNAAGTTSDASGVWHVFTGTSSLANWINVYPDGSTTLGAPTGANEGAGTLNVQGAVYDNGGAPTGTAGTGYVRATGATLTSPTINGPTLNTANIVGTNTNNNAAAGSVGELVSASVVLGSAVALTSGVAANVTSISLTAGDWDVSGMVAMAPAASTTQTFIGGAITTTSATFPGARAGTGTGDVRVDSYQTSVATSASQPGIDAVIPPTRYSLSGTTTVYLVATSTFAVSTNGAYGYIRARRVR